MLCQRCLVRRGVEWLSRKEEGADETKDVLAMNQCHATGNLR